MPKIQSITFCAASIPLDRVTSFSNRTVSIRHYGLVKVRSDDDLRQTRQLTDALQACDFQIATAASLAMETSA